MRDETGRYRIERKLGEGGMGVVYLARDTLLNDRPVALKVLSPAALANPDLRERFVRECEVAANIDHPNVLPVHDYSVGDHPYIAMRYVEGVNLHAELERLGSLPPRRAVDIVEQVAAGLDAAHRQELRHRDVKPSNILLEAGARRGSDHAWLFDWGIAQTIEAQPLTRADVIVGTVHYVAPERLRDGASDHRADIYALAVVLYECLAGRRPFVGRDVAVLMAHLGQQPPPLPPHIGPELRAVVFKGLAKNPDDRFQSAGDFAAAAHAALEAEREREIRGHGRSDRMRSRRAITWTEIAAALAGLLAGVVLGLAGVIPTAQLALVLPVLAVGGALIAFGARGLTASDEHDAPPDAPPRPDDGTWTGGVPDHRP
ncbi:serine/threonine-protein kinase [Actinokineospora globicatena]|uniref:non-specific serine/threonine protein kinase n=1 Tax=Actinokineospora globicatena TaxID=103729 RepID=A0A9W6QG65_9PSEU|nr:serine/threonine-protein kinase [Actinokineospora globicatena]GLW89843.1 hypothetical protein Aglo03_06590 [Actinokineospora globicatena]